MNYYPPRQARLGYILETKREVKIVDKFIDNFIESVDINTYFPDYFSFIFLPFFFVGIFYYVKNSFEKDYKMKISYTVLFTIFILSLVGVNGKYGPFILFPFIVFFIYIGLIRVFNLISFLV